MSQNEAFQAYLLEWEERYGEKEEAQTVIWVNGNEQKRSIKKLSYKEYKAETRKHQKANKAYALAMLQHNDQGIGQALAAGFSSEILLLA